MCACVRVRVCVPARDRVCAFVRACLENSRVNPRHSEKSELLSKLPHHTHKFIRPHRLAAGPVAGKLTSVRANKDNDRIGTDAIQVGTCCNLCVYGLQSVRQASEQSVSSDRQTDGQREGVGGSRRRVSGGRGEEAI